MPRTKHSSAQTLKVLLALILRDGLYGWQLSKQTGVNEKTVYGILKRLERDALVEDFWNVPGVEKPRLAAPPSYLEDEEEAENTAKKGAAQRRYKLTPKGAKFTLELQRTFGKKGRR
jgi:hypothetical protein